MIYLDLQNEELLFTFKLKYCENNRNKDISLNVKNVIFESMDQHFCLGSECSICSTSSVVFQSQ